MSEALRHAVTGNRLRDGVPIYFAGKGKWTPKIAEALTGENGDTLLAEALDGPKPLEAVGPYVIDVDVADGSIQPVGLKERIRAFGPTV